MVSPFDFVGAIRIFAPPSGERGVASMPFPPGRMPDQAYPDKLD
jgi:hypothetical protein